MRYSSIPLDDFPSLDEVFKCPPPSALSISGAVAHAWAKIYAKLLSDARFHNDYRHWLLVCMFEKIGLAAPPRGDKGKGYLSKQLKRWCMDPVGLWKARMAHRPKRRGTPDNSPTARARRAEKFAREGIAGRGVAALESGAMCPTDSKSLEKLKPKHPDALHRIEPFSFDDLPAAGR